MDSNEMNNQGMEPTTEENAVPTEPVAPAAEAEAAPEVAAQPVAEAEAAPEAEAQPAAEAEVAPEAAAQPVEQPTPAPEAVQPQPVPQSMPQAVAAQPPKKKGKGGLIAIIIAIVVLLIALVVGIVILLSGMLSTPASKVEKGFQNMQAEMQEEKNPVMELVKMDEILKKTEENGMSADASLVFSIPDSIGGIGLDMSADVDMKNKQLDMDLSVSIMNYVIASIEAAADEKNLYIAVPELFQETLMLPTENFAEAFNASELAYWMDTEVPEGYDLTIFPENEEKSEEDDILGEYFSEEFIAQLKEEEKALADSVTVEKTEKTETYDIDGKSVTCTGYKVSADAEILNRICADVLDELFTGPFMDEVVDRIMMEYGAYGLTEEDIREEIVSMAEEINVAIGDNMEYMIYLDKKNQIRGIVVEGITMQVAEEEMTFDMNIRFLGSESTLDKIEAKMTVSDGSEDVSFYLTRNRELTKETMSDNWLFEMVGDMDLDEYISLEYSADWDIEDMEYAISLEFWVDSESSMEITIEGGISDYEAGKSCTFEIYDAALAVDKEDMLNISGEFTIAELEEAIKMPSDSWDILSASESELQGFFMEIENSINSLIGGFLGTGGGEIYY